MPLVTLIVIGGAVFVYLVPDLHLALVYDRRALLGGEVWRVVTGPWVHFSASHFIYDILALGIAGWMIERRGYRNFGWLCALSPLATGIILLAFEPQLAICGGLSGIATAAVVFLAVYGLEETGAWRWICLIALIATAVKIWMELMTGQFVFLNSSTPSFVPVPSSHIIGALMAFAVYALSKVQKHARFRPPTRAASASSLVGAKNQARRRTLAGP